MLGVAVRVKGEVSTALCTAGWDDGLKVSRTDVSDSLRPQRP